MKIKIILGCIFCIGFINADQLLYKCNNGKSFVYYKNMNNKSSYNGWFEISNLPCQGRPYLNTMCDQGTMFVQNDDGTKGLPISGINCSDFLLSYPQSNFVM